MFSIILNQFESHVLNEDETFLCSVYFDHTFPFNKINIAELFSLNYNLNSKGAKLYTDAEQYSAYSQYASADSLNANNLSNDLSIFTFKYKKVIKKMSLLKELLISYKISPDIIWLWETKLNKDSNLYSVLMKIKDFI